MLTGQEFGVFAVAADDFGAVQHFLEHASQAATEVMWPRRTFPKPFAVIAFGRP